MTFPELLRTIAARLKLPVGAIGDDARNLEMELGTGQTIGLSLLDDDATCCLTGFICFYPPAEQQARFFEMLLGAHAFGLATQGASFGADMEANKIFLFQSFPVAPLTAENFAPAISRFAGMHRSWLDAQKDGKLKKMLEGPWPPGS